MLIILHISVLYFHSGLYRFLHLLCPCFVACKPCIWEASNERPHPF